MKKMTLILFTMFFVTIGNINAQEMQLEAAGADKQTPKQMKCPNGQWKSYCISHKWHGCSDDLGCR